MSKDGWLIWKDKFIVWKHETFKSKSDLTVSPHFELTVTDKQKDQEITFNDVKVKDRKLRDVKDLMKLPKKVQQEMLDNAVMALDKEYADKEA